MPEAEVGNFVLRLRNAFHQFGKLPFPTIAAIEGVALGGGLELALACDFRVTHPDVLLGLPETALAIIPGAGGTQRLPRLVGMAKAKEMIFLGQRLGGEEAMRIGLVTDCVEQGRVVARSEEIATAIADKGPVATRMAKLALEGGANIPLDQALLHEAACYANVIPTADRREGLAAFVEKRKPNYIGS